MNLDCSPRDVCVSFSTDLEFDDLFSGIRLRKDSLLQDSPPQDLMVLCRARQLLGFLLPLGETLDLPLELIPKPVHPDLHDILQPALLISLASLIEALRSKLVEQALYMLRAALECAVIRVAQSKDRIANSTESRPLLVSQPSEELQSIVRHLSISCAGDDQNQHILGFQIEGAADLSYAVALARNLAESAFLVDHA